MYPIPIFILRCLVADIGALIRGSILFEAVDDHHFSVVPMYDSNQRTYLYVVSDEEIITDVSDFFEPYGFGGFIQLRDWYFLK